ncbi:DUF6504 family protein [Symbiobacterium terraclitae]|uniref:DUF6504 family protein n=1 Tax=Symbiobacterium terraclitae TaxID=557451 RepID=UPI0035B54CD3
MARNIDQPIQVTAVPSPDGPAPSSFVWRGARYRVEAILDCWEEAGRWWEKEAPATAWRVQTEGGGVMELVRVHSEPPEWRLMRVWD